MPRPSPPSPTVPQKSSLWDCPRPKALERAARQQSPALSVVTVCFALCLTYVWPSFVLNESVIFNHTALVLYGMITLHDFGHAHPDTHATVLSGVYSHGPSSLAKLNFLKHKTDPNTVLPQILSGLLNAHREVWECAVWPLVISSSSSLISTPYLFPCASQPAP